MRSLSFPRFLGSPLLLLAGLRGPTAASHGADVELALEPLVIKIPGAP